MGYFEAWSDILMTIKWLDTRAEEPEGVFFDYDKPLDKDPTDHSGTIQLHRDDDDSLEENGESNDKDEGDDD